MWQPIETAPKDGTPILLVWCWDTKLRRGRNVILSAWTCRKHVMLSSPHGCPNEPDCQMGWGIYSGNFTHWMPLPKLPDEN